MLILLGGKIRDRQVSITMGKPMTINDHDYNVEDLEWDDFWDEPTETALYVIGQARLAKAGMALRCRQFHLA